MKLPHAVWRWFSPKIAYLDRTAVILDQNGRVADDLCEQRSRRLSILGKQHYHETVHAFPISDMKEIRAAVAMDPTAYAPFSTDIFFMRRLGRRQDRTLVNLWFVRPTTVETFGLDRAVVLIPETLLWSLQRDTRPRLDIISRDEGRLLLIHVAREKGVYSMLAEDGAEAVESFRRSLGPEGGHCPANRISSRREYFQGLLRSLKDTAVTDLAPFVRWRMDRALFFTPAVRRTALSLTAMLLVYLMLWLGLPLMTARRLTLENEQLTQSLSDALAQQDRITAVQEEIRMLVQPVEAALPKVPILNMLHDTLSPKAVISRLTIAANRVEIHGVSEKASTVIGTLNKVPGLMQVQLITPLSKDRKSGKDQFAVSFLIEKESFLNHMKRGKS